MAELPVPRSEINARLKKIEGQIRGIQKMVTDERDCVDIMMQLAATKSALQSVAGMVLRNYTSICLERKKSADIGTELARAVSIWVGGHI
ncbi:MAG: metal-sensitive transcriptional regulator [Chloroflexi bacterium]|nr:metal-sensitive transcriptional regulator [Chloroflexota bacterium]